MLQLNKRSLVLQAAVIKQDSILELLLQPHDAVTVAAGATGRLSWRDAQNQEVNAGSTIGELALLQRQHSLLQEELLRLRDAESKFRDSERARAKLERQVRQMKVHSGASSSCQQRNEELLQVSAEHPYIELGSSHLLLNNCVFYFKIRLTTKSSHMTPGKNAAGVCKLLSTTV